MQGEVVHASFTPLVFKTSGGINPLMYRSTFLKHLAMKLAEKTCMAYSTTQPSVGCRPDSASASHNQQ